MAVYTHLSAERLASFLEGFDCGALRSVKGIAEGVENSNFMVETDHQRFILTLYEKRVRAEDLPFFLGLMGHLATRGLPCPRPIPARDGAVLHELAGRPACLIEFLPGISVSHPTAPQAHATGHALGAMHSALADFVLDRPNVLGPEGWLELADRCGEDLDRIAPGFRARIADELAIIARDWPTDLPRSVIHADLFPDNVLMHGDAVTGVIDFYFACTEIRAWDLAVTHAAWCFENDGTGFDAARAAALVAGYEEAMPLSAAEYDAFPLLARGAALRFTLTRAWDWLNTPADAVVTRKDPRAFLSRLEHYAAL